MIIRCFLLSNSGKNHLRDFTTSGTGVSDQRKNPASISSWLLESQFLGSWHRDLSVPIIIIFFLGIKELVAQSFLFWAVWKVFCYTIQENSRTKSLVWFGSTTPKWGAVICLAVGCQFLLRVKHHRTIARRMVHLLGVQKKKKKKKKERMRAF